MVEVRDFVGKGFSFPFEFDQRTGGVKRVNSSNQEGRIKKVKDSIKQIIGVSLGEMFMSRTFGSDLTSITFLSNDIGIERVLEFTLTRALTTWERRVQIDNVQITRFTEVKNQVHIVVYFTDLLANLEGNLVFPIYLTGEDRFAGEETLAAG